MKHYALTFISLAMCSLLSACSPTWTKIGFDPAIFNADEQDCSRQSMAQFPVARESRWVERETYNCSKDWRGEDDCKSETVTDIEWYDANLIKRRAFQEACLRTKGYYLKGEE